MILILILPKKQLLTYPPLIQVFTIQNLKLKSLKKTYEEFRTTLCFNKPKDVKNIQIVIEGLSKCGNPGVLIKTIENN